MAVGALPLLAAGTGAAGGTPLLDIGYGPSTLFAASGGTPVYVTGDQLWVRSEYNSTVQVGVAPLQVFGGNSTGFVRSLEPGVPVRFLTFNTTSPQGPWEVSVPSMSSSQILFLVGSPPPVSLSLSSYGLKAGAVEMSFNASFPAPLFEASACVLGESNDSAARVPLPSGIGTGFVNVTRSGTELLVEPDGSFTTNSSLSVELWRSFSFLSPNSTGILLSRQVRVATSEAALLTGRGPLSLALEPELPLSPGTYLVRAFFQGPEGLLLETANVLIAGGSWVWLGGCRTFPVYSDQFALTVPLGGDPGSWPRTVWLTYTASGEEGAAELSLGLKLAAVDFVGAPWGVRLSNYDIEVTGASGVQETEVSNGTVFAILNSTSARIAYRAGLGGSYPYNGSVGPLTPFASVQADLNVSRVDVTYDVGGSGYEGAALTVSDAAGTLASGKTGANGEATFYLPGGRYNVTAVGGNSSATASVAAQPGRSEEVVIGASGSGGVDLLVTAGLAGAAVVGAAVNVGLWLRSRRGGPHRGGGDSKPSQK